MKYAIDNLGASCLDSDGVDDYMTMGAVNDFDGLEELTVSGWIRSEDLTGGTGDVRYVTGMTEAGNITFYLRQVSNTDTLEWYCEDGSSPTSSFVSGFTAGEWHHVCATYKSGVGTAIYLNGKSTEAIANPTIGPLSPSGAPLFMAAPPDDTGACWSGQLSSIIYHNAYFSYQDVGLLYEQAMLGYPDTLRSMVFNQFLFPPANDVYQVGNAVSVVANHINLFYDLGNPLVATAGSGGPFVTVDPPASIWRVGVGVSVSDRQGLGDDVWYEANARADVTVGSAIVEYAVGITVGVAVDVSIGLAGGGNILYGGLYRR